MKGRAICLLSAATAIGATAGLRTFAPLAAVSWAASLGALRLKRTPFAFLGAGVARGILTAAAVGELVVDQLPATPSRKSLPQFGGRTASGAVSGAALGATDGAIAAGLFAGVAGAVAGTLAGYQFRSRLARALRRDLPAALVEDAVAISGAALAAGRLG